MVNAGQVRAARAMLNWSQGELAKRANVSRGTVAAFENEQKDPWPQNLAAIERALEDAGVRFVERSELGSGVFLQRPV